VTVAGALELEPEPALPLDPDPELLVPDADPEPLEPLVAVPAVLAPVVAVTCALLRDRAGSCPDASWMKITDQASTKTVAAIASVRRRISDARRLRARSRSATTRFASRGVARRAGWLGEGGSGEELGAVMLYLSRRKTSGTWTRWRRRVAAV
jgi:hypothetical protein